MLQQERWARMTSERKEQMRARMREVARQRYKGMSAEQRRKYTEKARAQRWKFFYY